MASYVDNSFRQAVMMNPAERTQQQKAIVVPGGPEQGSGLSFLLLHRSGSATGCLAQGHSDRTHGGVRVKLCCHTLMMSLTCRCVDLSVCLPAVEPGEPGAWSLAVPNLDPPVMESSQDVLAVPGGGAAWQGNGVAVMSQACLTSSMELLRLQHQARLWSWCQTLGPGSGPGVRPKARLCSWGQTGLWSWGQTQGQALFLGSDRALVLVSDPRPGSGPGIRPKTGLWSWCQTLGQALVLRSDPRPGSVPGAQALVLGSDPRPRLWSWGQTQGQALFLGSDRALVLVSDPRPKFPQRDVVSTLGLGLSLEVYPRCFSEVLPVFWVSVLVPTGP
ncbi:unnamed protein product [Boreogadus saida]